MSELKAIREFKTHGYSGKVEVSVHAESIGLYVSINFDKDTGTELVELCVATEDVHKCFWGLYASETIIRKGLTRHEAYRKAVLTASRLHDHVESVLTAGLDARQDDEELLTDIMSDIGDIVER